MTFAERPDCATTIRQAGESTTAVRLLALPEEPPAGSEVELRAVDGYREGRWQREAPRGQQGTWPWVPSPKVGTPSGFSWRQVCEYAIRYRCELWLVREGPLPTTTEEKP